MTDYEQARRDYIRGELDKVRPSEFDGKIKVKFTGEGESKHLNITAAQYEAIGKILLPEPASPVTYDPCIQGTIEIEGRKSEFMILLDNPSVQYSQWGADNLVLWPRVDLLEGMTATAREWALDNLRPEEEYDGSCPADCSPDNEDTNDRPCSECGTDWREYDGEDYDEFRRTQREERENTHE